jgi:hypothetical protein
LLEIVRDCILRQKRRQDADFGADPFAFGVRRIGRMVAAASAAELRTEVSALNLIELLDLTPGFIAHGSGYVNFQFHDWHSKSLTTESQRLREKNNTENSKAKGTSSTSIYLAQHANVGEERVVLSDQAAGLVVRRLAISNASANMTSENRSKVAMADGSGNVRGASG